MKRNITLVLIFSFFITSLTAQNNSFSTPKSLRLGAFNMQLGVNFNQFQSMSHNELMLFAKDPEAMQRDLSNLTEEANAMTAAGVFNLSFSFSPLDRSSGNYRMDREIQFGVSLETDKEAMVSFKNQDMDTSIVFCNLHQEFSVEGAYIFRGNMGRKWEWYVGTGMNAGLTYGNEMMLISGKYFEPGQHPSLQPVDEVAPQIESFDAKNVFYSRAYIPFGLHYKVGEFWSFGIDMRKGIGLQMIGTEKLNFIRKTGMFALGARLRL